MKRILLITILLVSNLNIFTNKEQSWFEKLTDTECDYATLIQRIKEAQHAGKINVCNPYGQTPLHFWIGNKKYKQILTRFLAAGADPNKINGHDETPLQLAWKKGSHLRIEHMKQLLDYGANTTITDCNGNNIIHQILVEIRDGDFGIYTYTYEILLLLLWHHSKFEDQNNNKETILNIFETFRKEGYNSPDYDLVLKKILKELDRNSCRTEHCHLMWEKMHKWPWQ